MTPAINFNHTSIYWWLLCHSLISPITLYDCCGWCRRYFSSFGCSVYNFHLPITSGNVWKLICHSSLLNVRCDVCTMRFSHINITHTFGSHTKIYIEYHTIHIRTITCIIMVPCGSCFISFLYCCCFLLIFFVIFSYRWQF